MRRRYSTRSRFALSRRWLGRGLRTWGGVAAVAVGCSLLATSARAAETRVRALDRQFDAEHRRLAQLATASYEGSAPDQALAFFAGGDPQQVLGRSATIDYLAQQRDARDEQLHRLMVAGESARQAAQAKVAELQRMLASLAGQQDRVKHLLAQFRPQSPTIGDSITPRMREVRDEVDRRFGPFSARARLRTTSWRSSLLEA